MPKIEWEVIREALENPKFKWRTAEGVAKETGVPISEVVHTFNSKADKVIKSTIPSTTGNDLFTTREHYREMSSIWERFESAFTNKVRK